jgi:MarR family 2-MHQ and catechol resistance regulon transcriptional repressor
MGTHHRGTEAEIRALDAFIKLSRASDTVGVHAQASYAETGLTPSQFGTMETLYHLGPMCQSDIGKKILRSSGNITLVIDNLEKRALVRREREEGDRRRVSVHLTDEGRKLIARVFPGHVANITAAFGALTAEDQEELARLCKKLGKAVAAQPHRPDDGAPGRPSAPARKNGE